MKKVFCIMAVAALFACTNEVKEETPVTDTVVVDSVDTVTVIAPAVTTVTQPVK
jgi:hypothetical protein